MRILRATLLMTALTVPAFADQPADPLKSGLWDDLAERYLNGPVVFDNRVKVIVPEAAENQFQVPATIDASELGGVEEIVVITDYNPIQHALTFRPGKAKPYIGLRLKVEQTTPVRAAARTADGVWHVGGAIVEAAGGGCTAPAAQYANANWATTLGNTRAQAKREDGGGVRMTLRMQHPMDTGLAPGIPVFHLNRLEAVTDSGEAIGSMDIFEPVSENPAFTLQAPMSASASSVAFSGRDTEGNRFAFSVDVPPVAGN
jgi:sulfur-oxidizing protein SoxY